MKDHYLTQRLMAEEKRMQFLVELDERLLQGGVIISEWAAFLIRDADVAFVNEANLSCVITSLAAIEAYLRSEDASGSKRFVDLIVSSDLDEELKAELHELRKYRNKLVHVAAPWEDKLLLDSPELFEKEIEQIARRSIVALRRALYSNPFI
ncbi:hypothetical protein [Pseudomonas chlororaphis]|uniref:hypothetical protein n=1 Tax=Pseudomonas chlororaphis TaxID=587753 RepID=UPI000F562B44|nr:hypothetical protein [Pseudomonas chlororaphis]